MIKNLRLTSHVSHLTVLVLLALLVGCAAPQKKVSRRYFWPPAPEVPRVEFLKAYWGGADMPRSGWQVFIESLIGAENISLDRPWGITSDGEGKIYVTDLNEAAVKVFDTKKYTVTYLGGAEGEATLENPIGIALDAGGNVYVSDSKKNLVFVFGEDGRPLRTIGSEDTLKWPNGLAIDNGLGRLYVANAQGHNIAVFDLSGKYLFSFGRGGDRNGQFRFPNSVAVAPDGNVVVADSMNARVQVLAPDGTFIRKIGSRGDGITDLQVPKGVGVTKAGRVYVTDGRGNKIVVFRMSDGAALTSIGGRFSFAGLEKVRTYPGGFLQPSGLFIDKNDTIYVSDSFNSRIQIFQELNEEYLKEHPVEGVKTEDILKERGEPEIERK